MKKILAIIVLHLLVMNVSFAQPSTQPTPPPSQQDLSAQMQQLQQQMKQLQQQLQQMQNRMADTANKKVIIINGNDMSSLDNLDEMLDTVGHNKVIIINGQRLDDFNEKALDSSMKILEKNFKGLDSTTVKMYRNNDSVLINVGKVKIKMSDKDPNHSLIIEQEKVIKKSSKDSTAPKHVFKIAIGGLRLGVDNYLYKGQFRNAPGYDALALIPGKSIDVGIGIADGQLNIIKHYLTLHTMLGLDISNYRFSSSNTLVPKSDSVKFQTPAGDQNVTKNKLVTTYAVLPVRLQYQTSENSSKAFRIGVGGRIGYLIGSHTKSIINGEKSKDHDSFDLNEFMYGLECTIGYSWFNLYIDYDLTPLFSNGVNPQLTPVEVGVVLANF